MLSKIIGGGAVGGVRGQERVLGINMIKVWKCHNETHYSI
jgi:hypothetical protein